VDFGSNRDTEELKNFDAIILATGSTIGRPLPVPGSDLDGVHLAMNFLKQNNKVVAGDDLTAEGIEQIRADGKNVIVIGGGDTGSDCIGTSNRHGAKSVTNFELLPKPPKGRPGYQPWPFYPMKLNTSTSHQEGVDRAWGVLTKEIVGENGKVTGLVTVNVRFIKGEDGRPQMEEVTGTEKTWPADLIILALGFVGPEKTLPEALDVVLDERGNIQASETDYKTNIPNIFTAGDCRRGQSLIVWAISEGREAARIADEFLMGKSELPTKGMGQELPRIPFMVE
jgi:glutamate synthase (NADPH/NADH) small chain